MVDALAVGEIEFPAVPGTDQLSVFDGSLGQRASLVRANVAQDRDDAAMVGDADGAGEVGKFAQLTLGRKFEDTGNSSTLAHPCNISRQGHGAQEGENPKER